MFEFGIAANYLRTTPKIDQKAITCVREDDTNHLGNYFICLQPKYEFDGFIMLERLAS